MKKFLLTTAALLAMGATAVQAADMPVKAPHVHVWSWTGCYVGVQIGYKWGQARDITYAASTFAAVGSTAATPFNVNGALGGAEAGCNYQVGSWVFGIEVDGSWVAASGQNVEIGVVGGAGGNSLFRVMLSERWLATARGRIGYATGHWLWYVTA